MTEPESKKSDSHWYQFSVLEIAGLTTWIAISLTVLTRLGMTFVPVCIGLGILVLNAMGRLGFAQSDRVRPWLIRIAWLVFVLALISPVHSALSDYGALTAWGWAKGIFEPAPDTNPLQTIGDFIYFRLLGLFVTIGNLTGLTSLIYSFVRTEERGVWKWGFVIGAPAVLICIIPYFMNANGTIGGMMIGWYLWFSSFCLLGIAVKIEWRDYFLMAALMAAFIIYPYAVWPKVG